jgi:ankyrin repeat protein
MNTEVVEMLLEKEAHVNARGGKYVTALQAAVETEDTKVARMLLEKSADVNTENGVTGMLSNKQYKIRTLRW